MTVVLGASEFLLRRLKAPEARDDVEHIRRAAHRTAAITQQLLAFSRRQVLQPQIVDLNSVVTTLQPILQRANPLRKKMRLGKSGLGQHDDELLSTQSSKKRGFGHRVAELRGELLQGHVADRMAVQIVDALEMINVDDEDRTGLRPAAPQEFRQMREHCTAIGRAGEFVRHGKCAHVACAAPLRAGGSAPSNA